MRFIAVLMIFAGCNASPSNNTMCTVDCDLASGPLTLGLTAVYTPDRARKTTGIAFNAELPDQAWIIHHSDDSVTILHHIGTPQQSAQRLKDPASSHFMHRPTAIAWGAANTWATCGEGDNGGNNFMGPALFSGDLTIFAKPTPDGLGSHLDMLHNSPWCMGIAHQSANVYWVFDGDHASLTRYDFKLDHGPGADDHSDGEILRYAQGQVTRVANTPSHLVYRAADARLYVADTGGKRVVALDTRSGTKGRRQSTLEPSVPYLMDGALLVEIVPPGLLEAPSGIAIAGDKLYVGDFATSKLHEFDLAGQRLRTFETGWAAGSLGALTFGPDGRLWLVDQISGVVYRADAL